MTLPVVSVNNLPTSTLNGEPQAVNLPIVSFRDDRQRTTPSINWFIHTDQKLK
jgi:hypothetical protein